MADAQAGCLIYSSTEPEMPDPGGGNLTKYLFMQNYFISIHF